MRLFLDLGASLITAALLYEGAQWFVALPDPGSTFQTLPGGLIAIPMAFFILSEWWHMLKTRRWSWFLVALLTGGLSILPYYVFVHRKGIGKHDAQQGAPGDAPRPAGSGRA